MPGRKHQPNHSRTSWTGAVASDADKNMDSIPEDLEVNSTSSNVGHSLPNPDEVDRPKNKNRMWLLWVALFLLAVAATAIGVELGLQSGDDDTRKIQNAGTARDTASDEKRRIRLQRYLVNNDVNTNEEFEDPESPQSLALDFLANIDEQRLNAPSGDLRSRDGYSLLTRYVMSLFYYQMDGPNWNFDLLFLSDFDTCYWFSLFEPPVGQLGVICNENTNEITGFSFISDNISGELPKELAHLTTLSYIESIGNEVSGTIPDEFERLTNLRTMVFAWNSMRGTIPSWIDKLSRLEFMYLSNNLFTGDVPNQVEKLTNLKVLAMNDNLFNGGINSVWKLPKLEYVFLGGNQFTGQLPQSLGNVASELINLDVSGNGMVGPLPSDLFELSSLEIIDLHGNDFTGMIPETAITEPSTIKFVALHKNKLSGQIPPSLGRLNALTHLDLSKNKLLGGIPDLGTITDLKYLFLADNDFQEGPIPNFIFTFRQLKELSLKKTQRTGNISPLFGSLDKLVVLDLDNNKLAGSVPRELGTMTDLQFALLNRNFLDSTLPSELSNLSDLRLALFNSNNITGDFGPICSLPALAVAVNDCQETTCDCCQLCCSNNEDCHQYTEIASHDPSWETSYQRTFFDFSTFQRFGVRDVNKQNN
ncbi:MAG: hypothetical protein SGBAC_003026 [Bacillariaceae sp.]